MLCQVLRLCLIVFSNRPSARLLKRPVPPPAAMEPKPDPIEVTRLQLAATRPAVPKPDNGRSQDYAEEPLLDRKSVTKVDNDKKIQCFSVVIAKDSNASKFVLFEFCMQKM